MLRQTRSADPIVRGLTLTNPLPVPSRSPNLSTHPPAGVRHKRVGELGGREGARARPANDGFQEKRRQEVPAQDEGRQVSQGDSNETGRNRTDQTRIDPTRPEPNRPNPNPPNATKPTPIPIQTPTRTPFPTPAKCICCQWELMYLHIKMFWFAFLGISVR